MRTEKYLSLEERRQKNLEIYTKLVKETKAYRNMYLGEYAIEDIIEIGSELVVDIGCGHNQFINKLKERGISGIGVDLVNKAADIIAPAHKTTLDDNVATHITSFDCMEHLEPDGISEVLIEWRRIAKPGCLYTFSIATWPTTPKGTGKWQLHPTVWSPEKWKNILEEHGFHVERAETINVRPEVTDEDIQKLDPNSKLRKKLEKRRDKKKETRPWILNNFKKKGKKDRKKRIQLKVWGTIK